MTVRRKVFHCIAILTFASITVQGKNEEKLPMNRSSLVDEKFNEIFDSTKPANDYLNPLATVSLVTEQSHKRIDEHSISAAAENVQSADSPDNFESKQDSEHGLIHHHEPRKWNSHFLNKRSREPPTSTLRPNRDLDEIYQYLALRQALQQSQPLMLNQNQYSPLQSIQHLEERLRQELFPQSQLNQDIRGQHVNMRTRPNMNEGVFPMNILLSQPMQVSNSPNVFRNIPGQLSPSQLINSGQDPSTDQGMIPDPFRTEVYPNNVRNLQGMQPVSQMVNAFQHGQGGQGGQGEFIDTQFQNLQRPIIPIVPYNAYNRYPLVNETPQNKQQAWNNRLQNNYFPLRPYRVLVHPVMYNPRELLPIHPHYAQPQQNAMHPHFSNSLLPQGFHQHVPHIQPMPHNPIILDKQPHFTQTHQPMVPHQLQEVGHQHLNHAQKNSQSLQRPNQHSNYLQPIDSPQPMVNHQLVPHHKPLIHNTHTSEQEIPNRLRDQQQPHPVYHHNEINDDVPANQHLPTRNVGENENEHNVMYGPQSPSHVPEDHHSMRPQSNVQQENESYEKTQNDVQNNERYYTPVPMQQKRRRQKSRRGHQKDAVQPVEDSASHYSP